MDKTIEQLKFKVVMKNNDEFICTLLLDSNENNIYVETIGGYKLTFDSCDILKVEDIKS